ncbi:MAG TPA: PDZ domain-containing protein [Sphingomonas sp.]
MEMRHRAAGRRGERRVTVLILVACLTALLVIGAAERGLFTHHPASVTRIAIPGVTVDDDDDDGNAQASMPVVTSLRSDSEAERLGVRVGDHIAAVDGRPIRDVAGLRAVVTADRAHGPVALHILRGSAVWNVAIDRAEPPAGKDRFIVSGQ